MKSVSLVTETIVKQGILPLYFHKEKEISTQVLEAVYASGIRAVEYTNRGETALHNFKALVRMRNERMPDMLLGIGTIKHMAQAREYLDAGADFLVSPGYVHEVALHCLGHDIFYAPGCMTPSEIIQAENTGVKFIKLFPGNMLGPAFLSSIKDIFPGLLFMPTGGVDPTKESISSWFAAGVCAVGMGSKLISKSLMENREFQKITEDIRNVSAIIQQIKNK